MANMMQDFTLVVQFFTIKETFYRVITDTHHTSRTRGVLFYRVEDYLVYMQGEVVEYLLADCSSRFPFQCLLSIMLEVLMQG